MTDDLTGLANLAELHRALERELERAGHSQTPIALVLLHLEDFEPASASLDRAQADAVLVGVAGVLRRRLPPPSSRPERRSVWPRSPPTPATRTGSSKPLKKRCREARDGITTDEEAAR